VLVAGAPLDKHFGSSVSVVERILNGKDPMLPDISFSIVDVADVADVAAMHVIAIDKDAAKGKRFVASAGSRTFVQIAQALKTGFPQRKITTTQAPNFVIRLLSLFDADIRAILPTLGKHSGVSSRQAQNVLGIDFIPIEDSLVETANYLIDNGFVKA
jgi:dihydroflavonol-4-reductase